MQAYRPLNDSFSQPGEAEWRKLALRGNTATLASLTSSSADDNPVGPIYPRGNGPVLAMRAAGAPWAIVQRIDRGDANEIRKDIEVALRGGATGIELVFSTGAATHGRGILTDLDVPEIISKLHAIVRLDAGELTPDLALQCSNPGPTIVSVYDPVAAMAARGTSARPVEDAVADIAALIGAWDRDARPGLAFVADGRLWHDGGASEVQELGAVLASAVAIMRLLDAHGVAPARAFKRLGVALSADADQFLTMAKLRAVRLLFARLAEVIGLSPTPLPVHAETAWRMLSRREPTMNLVRETTAAFAAGAGGANSVTTLSPLFDDEPFNARMARNTQTILLEESSLYRAGDPGAGSGAVEALTGDLAAAAWALFTRIESGGGMIEAVRSGSIQVSVAAVRDARLEKVARRQIPLVGINVNVDGDAAIHTHRSTRAAIEGTAATSLLPIRLAEPFETLCGRNITDNGRRQSVFLVTLGHGDDPAAAADAFKAAGFEAIAAHGATPRGSLGEAFARTGARVACILLGVDGAVAAEEAASTLREGGARVVVAASASTEGVPPGIFDAILTADADLVSLFSDVLDRIAEPDENGQS